MSKPPVRTIFLLSLLLLCILSPAWPQDRNPAFREFLDGSFHELLKLSPWAVTGLGLAEPATGNQNPWGTSTDAPDPAKTAAYEQTLQGLIQWDRKALAPADQLDYDAYRMSLEASLGVRLHPSRWIPDGLPTPVGDDVQWMLMNAQPLGKPADIGPWITRLADVPRLLKQSVDLLKKQDANQSPLPRLVLIQIAGAIPPPHLTPANAVLTQYFNKKLDAMAALDRTESDQAKVQVLNLMEKSIYPAYKALKVAVEDLATRAPTAYTLTGAPADPAPYQALIAVQLGEKVPAAILHTQALEAMARYSKEMDALDPGTASPYTKSVNFLKNEPHFPERNEEWALALIEETKGLLPQWFSAPMPDFEPRFDTGDPISNYAEASLDGTRKAAINISSRPFLVPSGSLRLLWHEGVPGHALQVGLQRSNSLLPLFRRAGGPSGFIEGWAKYSETLMEQSPLGQDKYYQALEVQIQYFVGVMMALDTGLNGRGWTYKDALAFLTKNLPGGKSNDYDMEINRALYNPGQYLSYSYGLRQILALREDVQKSEGASFDLRRFHDRLLALGALPFSLVREQLLGKQVL